MGEFSDQIRDIYQRLYLEKKQKYNRSLSFGDYFTDRWERAKSEGFGAGTSVYDNVLILGDVKIGKNVWIGPNCILDGTGGLEIGDHVDISAGVHIYTHDTVQRCLSFGEAEIEYGKVKIGSGCYIGPNSIIQRGITIGDRVVIGALSLVNKDIPSNKKAFGSPVQIMGDV